MLIINFFIEILKIHQAAYVKFSLAFSKQYKQLKITVAC